MSFPDSLFNVPGSAPSQREDARRPLLGVVLLALATVGAGLVLAPPARLVGLGLLVVSAGALGYAWFRVRDYTNRVLTLVTLGVLGLGLSVGGVLLVISPPWGSSAVQQTTQLEPMSPDAGFVGPSALPGQALPSAPAHVSTLPRPVAKPSVRSTASPSAKPSTTSSAKPLAPDGAAASEDPRDAREQNADSDTPTETSKPKRGCSFGEVHANPDGTADLCMGSDSDGNETWQHAYRDNNGDWQPGYSGGG